MNQRSSHLCHEMLDPLHVVENFHDSGRDTDPIIREILNGTRTINIFALGRNAHTLRLIEKIQLTGIIDDFATTTSNWHGIQVIGSSDVPAGSIVINCAMSISPLTANARITALDRVEVITYSDLYRSRASHIVLPDFVIEARTDLTTNLPRYKQIFDRLADQDSKTTFNKVMSYRLTAEPAHMLGFTVRMQEQYFESFLGNFEQSIFVDCGGYDGDTTEIFATRHPHYRKIYFFEPSSSNMKLARERLVNVRDIEFIELGVSDSQGILKFNADAGPASAVSTSGPIQINVTTIDSYIQHPIDFIKMDLEGWELHALRGCAGHIRKDAPTLAIAVYHSIADSYKILEYILSLFPDYEIYLRHYTEGWSETVMYFVPRRLR